MIRTLLKSNIRNTICRPGYTATVRPPFEYTNAIKRQLMRIYGVRGSIHDYELDHYTPGTGRLSDLRDRSLTATWEGIPRSE